MRDNIMEHLNSTKIKIFHIIFSLQIQKIRSCVSERHERKMLCKVGHTGKLRTLLAADELLSAFRTTLIFISTLMALYLGTLPCRF
jgi:hypothetical protein